MLPYDTPVTVRVGHELPLHCRLEGVGQDRLSCETHSFLRGEQEYEFKRSDISNVRFDQSFRNRWIMIGAFTLAGIAFGAAPGPGNPGTPGRVEAAELGAAGVVVGWLVSDLVVPWIPGRLIYHMPVHTSAHTISTWHKSSTRLIGGHS